MHKFITKKNMAKNILHGLNESFQHTCFRCNNKNKIDNVYINLISKRSRVSAYETQG